MQGKVWKIRLIVSALAAAFTLAGCAMLEQNKASGEAEREMRDGYLPVGARPGIVNAPARKGPQWEWHGAPSIGAPVSLEVDLSEQRLRVKQGGQVTAWTDVSTGKPGYETPTGSFRITQKKRSHFSNLYGVFIDEMTGEMVGAGRSNSTPPPGARFEGASMPYMQRLTDDGICLHSGAVVGVPASSGCIRLPDSFARQLFAATEIGTPVTVRN